MTIETSYFSPPSDTLDPDLFDGDRLKEHVRLDILARVVHFLHVKRFHAVETWLEAWLAGSGVSYQWHAHRDPGDLDCLLGVHYEAFREAHPKWARISDSEIAAELNQLMWDELVPTVTDYMGKYELTYYVNPDSTDIRNINPYAAYDLKHGEWTVRPDKNGLMFKRLPEWEREADRDNERAQAIVARYTKFLDIVQRTDNPAARINADVFLRLALSQAEDLYEDIHRGRRAAFSRTGKGASDFGNYRWQAGKERGTVQALKTLTEYYRLMLRDADHQTYGMELPDTQTLIRRSALWEQ